MLTAVSVGVVCLAWLVISAMGAAVSLHGAVALDSRILGYLAILFMCSTVFVAAAAVRPGALRGCCCWLCWQC